MDGIVELNNSYFRDIPQDEIVQMRNTLLHVLDNMNVDFEGYMNSKYEDPFYTHLHVIPADADYEMVPLRIDTRKKSKSLVTETITSSSSSP